MKAKCEKLKNYLKANKFYVITMFIGTLLMLIQMKQVVLYADDMSLGIISKQGLKAAFEYLNENYMTWGGGPTPFIAIIFLMYRVGVWKIFATAMVVITIILAVRMITYNNKINKGLIAICIWIMIYILNIHISSETLYWLDGNLAYMLTTFQMFIYFYYLYSRIIMKTKEKKYDYIVLPIFAFFAGWSGPQAGAITVIMPILLFVWQKFINKEKIKKIYWISFFIGILGFLIYYFAPGNKGRAEFFPEYYDYNFIGRLFYRANAIWTILFNFKENKFASIPFYLYLTLGLLSVIAIKKTKTEEKQKISKKINIISKTIIMFIIFSLIISLNFIYLTDNIKVRLFNFSPLVEYLGNFNELAICLIPYIVTGIVLILGIILSYYISLKEKNPIVAITFTCAILGQLMMALAPYTPYRATLVTIYLLWVVIAYLIKCVIKENIKITEIFVLVVSTAYSIWAGIILLFAIYVFKGIIEEKNELKIILIITTIFAGIIYIDTTYNYYKNRVIFDENINRIYEFKENPTEDKILYLKRRSNNSYGFTDMVGEDWIEKDVKKYFELDKDVILKYENRK